VAVVVAVKTLVLVAVVVVVMKRPTLQQRAPIHSQ
jgi:hypothetical protein